VGCGCNEDASARDCGDVTTISVSSRTIQTREARNVKEKNSQGLLYRCIV